jgi:hypothetical protein
LKQTTSERVDDLPVIIYWLLQMGIEQLIDQELPRPHGNRRGLPKDVSLLTGLLKMKGLRFVLDKDNHRQGEGGRGTPRPPRLTFFT